MIKKIILPLILLSFSSIFTIESETGIVEPKIPVQEGQKSDSSELKQTSQLTSAKELKPANWQTFLKNFASTMALGAFIGTTYGASCGYLEQYVPSIIFLWPISWLIFKGMRNATVEAVDSDLKKNNINSYTTTLQNIAWISDWLAYAYVSHDHWANFAQNMDNAFQQTIHQINNMNNNINQNLANNLDDLYH